LSNGSTRSGKRLPLACNLSGPEVARRRGEIEGIFEGCLGVDELEDGYQFHFPGSAEWAARLTEFIVFERGCCPFFTFELIFEPEGGPIRLRVLGPEGAKEIAAELAASRVTKHSARHH
jgi:hypothetical protein